jgi:hypothetical protein
VPLSSNNRIPSRAPRADRDLPRGFHEPGQRIGSVAGEVDIGQHLVDVLEHTAGDDLDQFRPGLEVSVDGDAAQTCLAGDVAHAGVGIRGETAFGRVEDRLDVPSGIGTTSRRLRHSFSWCACARHGSRLPFAVLERQCTRFSL